MLELLTESGSPSPDGEANDDDLIDMANLREEQTGVPGVIFVSTRAGRHGPQVKWYEQRPAPTAPSFSVDVAEPPEVVASDAEARIVARRAPTVIEWVRLNRETLLRFWNDGATLFEDERNLLLSSLSRLD